MCRYELWSYGFSNVFELVRISVRRWQLTLAYSSMDTVRPRLHGRLSKWAERPKLSAVRRRGTEGRELLTPVALLKFITA